MDLASWSFWFWALQTFCIYSFVLAIVAAVVMIIIARSNRPAMFTDFQNLSGKTIVVTGGALGLEAARVFVQQGARVIIGTVDEEDTVKLADEVKDYPGTLKVALLDTSSFASVRKFARFVLQTEKQLNVLCLTYFSGATRIREITEDGIEKTMAANYLGHFLLSVMLYPLLISTKDSRVVVSITRNYVSLKDINPLDLTFEKEFYSPESAVSLSMVCLVLFTRYFAILASRYDIRVNCYWPGYVGNIQQLQGPDFLNRLLKHVDVLIKSRTPWEGCQTLLFLVMAGNNKVGSGGLYSDCMKRQLNELAMNQDYAQRVFDVSKELVGLTEEELKRL